MTENKNIMRRIIAKLADELFSVIFVMVFATIAVLFITLIAFMGDIQILDASLSPMELADKMLVNLEFTVIMAFIVHLAYFIYFGLIGTKTRGSLGKYMVNLQLSRRDQKGLKAWQLYLREPIVISNLITTGFRILFLIVGMNIEMLSSISMAITTYYLVTFLLKKDFWNKNYYLN